MRIIKDGRFFLFFLNKPLETVSKCRKPLTDLFSSSIPDSPSAEKNIYHNFIYLYLQSALYLKYSKIFYVFKKFALNRYCNHKHGTALTRMLGVWLVI